MTTKTLPMENACSWKTQPLNLVSWSLLNRARLKIVLEGDKVVLTKNGDFVGKGYLSNGHVNFASIRKLKDLRLINTSESHETDKTPYELWKGHAPNLSYLKVWGCLAKVPFPALKNLRLSKRMHDPENTSIVSETLVSQTVNTSNLRCELELRRSKRQRTEKSFGPDFLSTFIVERRDEIDCNFTNLYLIDEDPKTYQEAVNSVESSIYVERGH
ncbi:ty1-copia retrotransposon protein [Cucumis melo var. makuwa]|uniref:Ty1-copia retrotransposon protein n=1 Tax=Cucumis melo var. makuwa TaxID=1194695 RepID=A0A5D3BWX3_CUCMM|nr:ty1-copia retrotransposon protein [Cucumis melo var. makuwa]TYK03468.1 ty1-copia retrotransposon protein [Cucumis melo var. makuwa]